MSNTNNQEQNDNEMIELSRVTCEELAPSYEEWLDELDRQCDEAETDDEHGMSRADDEPREDNFRDDVDADANALASAGWGTDEDYAGDYFDGSDW